MKVPMLACIWTNPDGSVHGFASDDESAVMEAYTFRVHTWPNTNPHLSRGDFVPRRDTELDEVSFGCALSLGTDPKPEVE